jgi:hypothetical protein
MLSTSFLNQAGRRITTNKPIVLVIGIGPKPSAEKTIKTKAHVILARVETFMIGVFLF